MVELETRRQNRLADKRHWQHAAGSIILRLCRLIDAEITGLYVKRFHEWWRSDSLLHEQLRRVLLRIT